MASVASPIGLTSAYMRGSAPASQGNTNYNIDPADTVVIRFGDLVRIDTDGFIARSAITTDATAAGQEIVGVFLGCEYTIAGGLGYRLFDQSFPGAAAVVAADGVKAFVADDPGALFQIQADEAVVQAALGSNMAVVNTAGGDFGRSRIAADGGSSAVTAALPLRVIGFAKFPGSVAGDAFTDLIVQLNNHQHVTLAGI